MQSVTIDYATALHLCSLMESKIRDCAKTYRDFAHGLNNIYAREREIAKYGRSWIEESTWSRENYLDHMEYCKVSQYTEYLNLVKILAKWRDETRSSYISTNVAGELINIKPLFLEGYVDAVKKELRLMGYEESENGWFRTN